jgi:ATP phosphoribosyltransferase regulatory subunit
MKQKMLHTPEGVRDIYGIEYRKKLILEEKLQKVLHLYGYHDIQTPMFEYFDVFGKEIGTIPSKELYKFFDREGETLVLRPDITPSIARVATTLFELNQTPLRLCYKGNTFINHSSYQGRLREHTQLGAELIGSDSVEADAEMIAMAVQGLKEAGLDEFQIHIGNVDFFEGLIKEADLEEEKEQRLRELITNGNYFGVDELLVKEHAKVTIKAAFQMLPELVGGQEVLKNAKAISLNQNILDATKRLEQIYNILVSYGVEKYITFDLSMSGTYRYYTGIIFKGYTFGTGDAIVKGGRYDHLMGKFGKEAPSIGFVIVVDELLAAFTRQNIEISYQGKSTYVLYDADRVSEAILLANEFRKNGKVTELVKRESEVSMETYMEHAKKNLCISMMYLKNTKEIDMINLVTGARKVMTTEIK